MDEAVIESSFPNTAENILILQELNIQYKDNIINDQFGIEQLEKSSQHFPFEEKESKTQICTHSHMSTGKTDNLKIEDDIRRKHNRHQDTATAEYQILKTDPEIVNPHIKSTTIRPHKSTRRPEII